jgi:transposase InsO family protein
VPGHRSQAGEGSGGRSSARSTGAGITHKRTRPYRPQINGKVERYNRILLEEWAYARRYTSATERRDTLAGWLRTYKYHRAHTALGGKPPASRVPYLPGQNS